MELISWSLSAIDKVFSTRNAGEGEPQCPSGTFPAGYSRGYYDRWQTVCLASLSVADWEDPVIIGILVVGILLGGAAAILIYRKIASKDAIAAVNPRLVALFTELARSLGSQLCELGRAGSAHWNEVTKAMNSLTESISARFEARDRKLDAIQEDIALIKDSLANLNRHFQSRV